MIPSDAPDAPSHRRWWWPLLAVVLVVSLAMTAWAVTRARVLAAAEARFAADADAVVAAAEARLTGFARVLRGAAGLVWVAGTVPPSAWEAYVDGLDLARAYPGFSGMSVAWRIHDEGREQLDRWVAGAVGEYFDIRPDGERAQYLPVVRVAPAPADLSRVLGFDLLSDPVRREAAERAWRSGALALSAHTAVRGDSGEGEPAFSLLMPIYVTAQAPSSEAGRAVAATGVISAEFRAAAFLESLLSGPTRLMSVHLHDSRAADPAERLAVRGVDEPMARFTAARALHVGGHSWYFRLASTPAYEAQLPGWQAAAAAGAVLVLGSLFAALMLSLAAGRRRARDTAQQLRAEVQDASRRLQLALDGAGEGGWDWDPARGGMHASARTLAIFGVTEPHPPSQLLAVWRSRLHPDDRATVDLALSQHLEAGVPLDMRYRVVLPDGAVRWVRTRGQARHDAGGNLLGVAGFVADVSAAQQAAEAQTRLAACHAGTLALLPGTLLEFDAEGRCVARQGPDDARSGLPMTDVVGRRLADLLPAAAARRVMQAFHRVAVHGGVERIAYERDGADGETPRIEAGVTRIETGGFLCLLRPLGAHSAHQS
ncbi:CHASE domain-containing protein [Denitromonas iodatirespirans]|uniref:histidine kinase n=1 Tax=Denitromonas iodatirespirans TaxID=2795389 RepID=A0A944H782_DENI1|nr:CHASE domain-containing protein [Denitromonas iodatirespirans]MBT0960924.1 CHASE domain-containing protein [Denitromonas iodatirespirans]